MNVFCCICIQWNVKTAHGWQCLGEYSNKQTPADSHFWLVTEWPPSVENNRSLWDNPSDISHKYQFVLLRGGTLSLAVVTYQARKKRPAPDFHRWSCKMGQRRKIRQFLTFLWPQSLRKRSRCAWRWLESNNPQLSFQTTWSQFREFLSSCTFGTNQRLYVNIWRCCKMQHILV